MLRVVGFDELEVPDDTIARHRDEHLPGVEIGVELRRGVLGYREQRPEPVTSARMEVDAYPAGIGPGGWAAFDPRGPGHDLRVGTGRLVEHHQVLEEVPVGIAEVHGGGRHPADDARLGGLVREERERGDAEVSEAVARGQHVVERRAEGNVQREPDGSGSE